MRRRSLVMLPLTGYLQALTRQDALDRIAPLAAALSEGDAAAFMRRIAETAPDRAQLRQNVTGLIARYEITCSIDVAALRETEADFDWYMELRSRTTATVQERRRGNVTIVFGAAQIRDLRPAAFFRAV